jgi:hypothetical protein
MSTISRSPLLLRGKTGKFILTNGRQWILCLVMNKFFSIFAALTLSSAAASAQTNQFNPTSPLNVVDQGGFTGTASSASEGQPYTQVRLFFTFAGLNPNPLPSSFEITNIFIAGPGISSSLSLGSLTITGNSTFITSYGSLNTNVQSLNFETDGVAVSFDLPAGVMNDGATFSIAASYADSTGVFQVGTSSAGPTFEAVPEPSTYALLALAAVGLAAYRWRQRAQ